MLADHILTQLAVARKLKIEAFDLTEAMQSKHPVYFWHSFNGLNYSAYELLSSNSFNSNIAIGLAEHEDRIKKGGYFLGLVNRFYFVEHNGLITNSSVIWPDNLVLWLGDAYTWGYRLQLQFVKTTLRGNVIT